MPAEAPIAERPRAIGIAVVIHAGRVLVGIRGPDGPLPGLAEFPGGKCEPGETPEACAIRECAEESGLAVAVEERLGDVVWEYPHGRVHLHFVLCRPLQAADVQPQHHGFRWLLPDQLAAVEFPEANRSVLALVRERLS